MNDPTGDSSGFSWEHGDLDPERHCPGVVWVTLEFGEEEPE